MEVGAQDFDCAMRGSLFVSADMAHAVHPNYSSKHGATGRPMMNQGVAVKVGAASRCCALSNTRRCLSSLAFYGLWFCSSWLLTVRGIHGAPLRTAD